MKKWLVLLFLFMAPCAFGQTVTITWGTTYQTIDGFGASTGVGNGPNAGYACDNSGDFGPYMNSSRANVLYNTAGLSLVRMQVCPDGTYPDNTAMSEILSANPNAKVWAVPWTPPVSYTSSGTIYNGANCLLTADYSAYATYLTNWVEHEQAAGIPIYMLSVQNEPDYTTSGDQPVCGFSASQFDTFIASYLGPDFAAAGLTTSIALPETSDEDNISTYAGTCIADSNCVKYVRVVTTHAYSGTIAQYAAAQNLGIHLWETEVYSGATFTGTMADALTWAEQIHNFLTVANASAWHYWLLIGDFGDNEPFDSFSGSTDNYASRLYAVGNWSKFVLPGWVRIGATANPTSGVYCTAFKSGVQGAVVCINTNGTTSALTFTFSGAPTFTSVVPVLTSTGNNLVSQSQVAVSSNSFSYTLPASSVETFLVASTGTAPTAPGNIGVTVQ